MISIVRHIFTNSFSADDDELGFEENEIIKHVEKVRCSINLKNEFYQRICVFLSFDDLER